jgi:capsular polysaccharide biosynthesis protein
MIDPTWRVEETDPDDLAGSSQPALVSLNFLLAALRRRWRFWAAFAAAGLLLGLAYVVLVPPTSVGTVTVVLTHDSSTDPEQAMATELSILRTRSVAEDVIDDLGLDLTPEDLQDSVVVGQASTKVLVIDVPGEDDADAVARADAFAESYLAFRAEQVDAQTNGLLEGHEARLEELQSEVDLVTRQYDALVDSDAAGQDRAGELLARRSQLDTEINAVQQAIQDTTLQNSAVISGSRILDPAKIVPRSELKRQVLAGGSALLVGGAMGVGLVLSMALTSTRLRRREEVALALGVPVRFSVGELRRRWSSHLPGRGSERAKDLEVLVRGIDSAIAPRKRASRKSRPARLSLATVDDIEATGLVICALAAQFTHRGLSVFLVDLSESGGLETRLSKALDRDHRPTDPSTAPVVFRPEGVPSFARGPVGSPHSLASDLPSDDPLRPAWDSADVVLTLAEINPAVGVDHLKSWADQVVLLVTAGRSSAERVRTTAGLLRASGLKLPFAVLVGADRTDESLGLPDPGTAGVSGSRRSS